MKLQEIKKFIVNQFNDISKKTTTYYINCDCLTLVRNLNRPEINSSIFDIFSKFNKELNQMVNLPSYKSLDLKVKTKKDIYEQKERSEN